MKDITTYDEAAEYIAEKYIFNEENYPLYRKLNDQERRVFAITQCLLNIQSAMYIFLTESEDILYNVPNSNYRIVESSATLIINIFKISEIMGTQLIAHSQVWHWREEHKESLVYIGKIATECGKFNRGKTFNKKNVHTALFNLWSQFLSIANNDKFKDLQPEVFNAIAILL
jgi:hypothetical protein